MCIGTYYRVYPLRTFVPNDSTEKASVIVMSRLRSQVDRQIRQQYPDISAAQNIKLRDQMFRELQKKDGAKIRQAIENLAQTIDAQSGPTPNTPYMLASDSFHFLQLTEQLIETGHISDTIKGSKYLNKLMLAPIGHYEPLTLHPHVGAGLYYTLRLFQPDISLSHALSFTPIVLTAITLIVFIWIAALIHSPWVTTLTASIFLTCSPIFVKRSAYGWYDNDPYNTLFPLLILALVMKALQTGASRRSQIIFACLAAFTTLIYSMFWQGWMLVFMVVIGTGVGLLLFRKLRPSTPQTTRQLATVFGLIGLLSFAMIGVKFGFHEFFNLFAEGYKALANFVKPQLSVWPDLYISVGELHKATLAEVIALTGGRIFFGIGLMGILLQTVRTVLNPERHSPAPLFLTGIFYVFSIWITLGAQRFALLCLVPFSIAFLMGLNQIHEIVHWLMGRQPSNGLLRNSTRIIGGLLIVTLTVIPIRQLQRNIPGLLNPIYNDTWHAALTQIEQGTPPNSIVNTWWSPGHFIKATAKRRVTFDGATINYPQAFWMTRVFLSQTEEEAIGLLRMLNSSANQAAEYLAELGFSVSDSVAILRTITRMDRYKAGLMLRSRIDDVEQIKHILSLTHTRPDPSYLFLYNELIEKNIQFAFIGNWNFESIEALNENPERLAKIPDRSSKEYVQFLWQLAGGPFKYNAPLNEMHRNEQMVLFDGNIKVDLLTKDCRIDSPKFGRGAPQSIFFTRNNELIEQKFENGTLPFSVMLVAENNKFSVVLLDQALARSMLMRLHYYGDTGLKYFRQFTRERDLTRRTDIQVFEVDWDQFERDGR